MLVKQPEQSPSLTPNHALKQVVKLTGTPLEVIFSTQRGAAGNPARALAIWWLIHGARLTNAQVGEILSISPSAVSRIIKKFRDAPEKYLGGRINKWRDKLLE